MERSKLNGESPPFQGWLLPEPSVDPTRLSSENLPSFNLFDWSQNGATLQKSEPAEICLDFDSQVFTMSQRERRTKTPIDETLSTERLI